jgi:hypothetical protein
MPNGKMTTILFLIVFLINGTTPWLATPNQEIQHNLNARQVWKLQRIEV